MKKKLISAIIALTLVLVAVVGGTMAWLSVETDDVVNTFTYGDINITLTEEHSGPFKIIPGVNITKDPIVTVKSGSEDCWVFVTVEEEHWPTNTTTGGDLKVNYAIDAAWTKLSDGVYYKKVTNVSADTRLHVLADDVVTVSGELTKTEVDALKTNTPKLTFTAYAIQAAGFADAGAAWTELNRA